MRFKHLLAAGALLAVASPVVAQSLVNGDFEQWNAVGWTISL